MKLLKQKYWKLEPSIKLLSDKLVLAQAWKKSHSYIRSRNWYADTLALDVSALTIEESVERWSKDVASGVRTREIEVILAGKSEAWNFSSEGTWQPKNNRGEAPPLRPLSHLAIRDQTLATAVMLCTADAVESKQGECTSDPLADRRNKVFSYGNRLVCDWRTPSEGWFRWGNSETYRKYFTDYQSFLNRPAIVGQSLRNNSEGGRQVYILSLDFKSFFNSIDITLLIQKLKDLRYHKAKSDDEWNLFWGAVEQIFSWRWDEQGVKRAERVGLQKVTSGLPQGLVSAGYFANAYMLDFDEAISDHFDKDIGSKGKLYLHDYCRYVDDIKLVVSADFLDIDQVKKDASKFVKKLLRTHCTDELNLNDAKTKINSLSDIANAGSVSQKIRLVQQDLSSPADREGLESTLGILESFLSMPNPDRSACPPTDDNERGLFEISQYDQDVRNDTLKRFAANRLETVVRKKRMLTSRANAQDEKYLLSEAENQLLAKKLISAWISDPSLALLLRKAMEIYPDSQLFEPVLAVINDKSSYSRSETDKPKDLISQAMMDFLLADFFRCGIDFTFLFEQMDFPEGIKPQGILEMLARYANKVVVDNRVNLPHVRRQALMLLAVLNKPASGHRNSVQVAVEAMESEGGEYQVKDIVLQRALTDILTGEIIEYRHQTAVLFEVASQITGQYRHFAKSFFTSLKNESDEVVIKRLTPFAKRGGEFWDSIWHTLEHDLKPDSKLFQGLAWAAPMRRVPLRTKEQTLLNLIRSRKSPFGFEHSLLKLARALFKGLSQDEVFRQAHLKNISVKVNGKQGWSSLYKPNVSLTVSKYNPYGTQSEIDPRYQLPEWIDESPEKQKVYWVGMIIRAAVLGADDFTGRLVKENKISTYKGVRTTWYKRRMAMMHSPETLVGEDATVSDWFSEFLMKCLQWPGFEVSKIRHREIADAGSIAELINVIDDRLETLNSLYCSITQVPGIPTQVGEEIDLTKFKVVTVQPLLPSKGWFKNDIELMRSEVRSLHREHIASICQLVEKTLKTNAGAAASEPKRTANLIVFPESSVHIDDQDLLRSLADNTKAIIFAGMVFTKKDSKLVNFGRWFIPNYKKNERTWMIRDQGKYNLTEDEIKEKVKPYRPCQQFLEVKGASGDSSMITAAICFDATDIKLSADLRDKSDLFIVAAYNQDVATFDNMAKALHWHMYQHVVISNIGIFGGSTMQAPYKQPYDKVIAHVHGLNQIAISMADLDLKAFTRKVKKFKEVKARPAGFDRA